MWQSADSRRHLYQEGSLHALKKSWAISKHENVFLFLPIHPFGRLPLTLSLDEIESATRKFHLCLAFKKKYSVWTLRSLCDRFLLSARTHTAPFLRIQSLVRTLVHGYRRAAHRIFISVPHERIFFYSHFSWCLPCVLCCGFPRTCDNSLFVVLGSESSCAWFLLVEMAVCWFLESTHLIRILLSKLILLNNQSKSTLRVLETCLSVGFLFSMIILCTDSLSSSMHNGAPWQRKNSLSGRKERHWTIQAVSVTFECEHESSIASRMPYHATGVPVVTWLSCCFRFDCECSTSITKSQKSNAGIPSKRRLASTETNSDFAVLCGTHVCSLSFFWSSLTYFSRSPAANDQALMLFAVWSSPRITCICLEGFFQWGELCEPCPWIG